MIRSSTVRSLLLALGAVTALVGRGPAATADIPAPGTTSVRATVEIDWGPLAGRLARPVAATGNDTWETLATREAGDVRWATVVKDLNGGGERPTPSAQVWVPPRDLAPGGDATWYSAFLDSSKFGSDSDVSRTGLRRIDPAAKALPVFGSVTVALLRHATPADAARAAALPSPQEALAARGDEALVVAAPVWVVTSVRDASPVRRVAYRWRCAGVEGHVLRLVPERETAYDADDRPLSASEAAGSGLRPEAWAGLVAIAVLSIVMLVGVRRWRRGAAGA